MNDMASIELYIIFYVVVLICALGMIPTIVKSKPYLGKFFKCFWKWLKIISDYPIPGEYYIAKSDNPYNAAVVLMTDKYEDTVQIKYLKSSKFDVGSISIGNVEYFFKIYEWISPKNVKKFVDTSSIYDNKNKPLFSIDKYDVYHIDKNWYIIPKGTELNTTLHPHWRDLSIALIEHDL